MVLSGVHQLLMAVMVEPWRVSVAGSGVRSREKSVTSSSAGQLRKEVNMSRSMLYSVPWSSIRVNALSSRDPPISVTACSMSGKVVICEEKW